MGKVARMRPPLEEGCTITGCNKYVPVSRVTVLSVERWNVVLFEMFWGPLLKLPGWNFPIGLDLAATFLPLPLPFPFFLGLAVLLLFLTMV